MTLQEVLGTNGQACMQFYAFCKKEHCLENIRFALAARQLRGLPCAFHWLPNGSTQAETRSYVYNRFIPNDAPEMININAINRKNLVQAAESLDEDSFEFARYEIEQLMAGDVFQRFLKSRQAAAEPVASAQPVMVAVAVPASAPVLQLAQAAEPPDPKPPIMHHQIGPPPNLVAAPAIPQNPPPALQLLRAHKPGPHLRNPAPLAPQIAVQAPPPLPPLPRVVISTNLNVPPQPPPRPRAQGRIVVRNVYVVNNS